MEWRSILRSDAVIAPELTCCDLSPVWYLVKSNRGRPHTYKDLSVFYEALYFNNKKEKKNYVALNFAFEP